MSWGADHYLGGWELYDDVQHCIDENRDKIEKSLNWYNFAFDNGLSPNGFGKQYPKTPEELFKDVGLWEDKPAGWGGEEDYIDGLVTLGEDVGE